jgi:UDP-galactopyranose mutase
MNYKYVIVGCGLSGAVIAERIASVLKEKVLIVDKRPEIAGNIYDYKDLNDIFVHKYGPHAFHTDDEEVWVYLSKFTKWHLYAHRVKSSLCGKEVCLPFSFKTLYEVFPQDYAQKLEEKLINKYGLGQKISVLTLKNDLDTEIGELGNYVYKKFYEGYSAKQWGLKTENLDTSVLDRVKIILSHDDRYFQDKYQAIPIEGYTEMVKNMLDNPLITLKLNTNFSVIKNEIKYEKLIYTGAIDEFFEFKHGALPYRSLSFEFNELDKIFFQGAAQVNYSETELFTRITEFKYFLDTKSDKTVIAFEYPQEYVFGENEQYYPISSKENQNLYEKYKNNAPKNILFLGRLGEYKYLNMDQAVKNALDLFKDKIISLY